MVRIALKFSDWHFFRGYRKAIRGRVFGVKVLKVVDR